MRWIGRYLPAALLLASLASLAGMAAGALAAPDSTKGAGPWASNEQAALRLVALTDRVPVSGHVRLGLQVRLEPGWKFYWRSPGDAGVAPRFAWTGSENLRSVKIAWPAPHRDDTGGIATFAYPDEVVLPVDIQVRRADAPLRARLRLDYGLCREICIPYQTALVLELPPGFPALTRYASLIEQYVALVPQPPAKAAARILQVVPAGQSGRTALLVSAMSSSGFAAPVLIVEGPGEAAYGRPVLERLAGQEARFVVPLQSGMPIPRLAGRTVTLTLLDGDIRLEQRVKIGRAGPALSRSRSPG